MQVLDNLLILGLIAAAFVCGVKVSEHYNRRILSEQQYASKILAAQNGLGYIAPPESKKKIVPIGQPFMDTLEKHGRAVTKLNCRSDKSATS